KLFQTLAFPIYTISILSLLGLFVFGKEIAGAQSWYAFGSFSLQPSEFAKFATALATAKYLSTKGVSMTSWASRFAALLIVFLPAAIIVPQPDPGSALVYTAFFLVFYREGLSGNYIFAGFALVILFILSLLFSKLYLFLIIGAIGFLFILLYRRSRGAIF